MDIKCKFCGEPMDTDEFHDAENGTWQEWINAFKSFGCTAVNMMFDGDSPSDVKTRCSSEPCENENTLMGIEILQDMMGDDIDGLAVMTEDMEMMEGFGF